MSTFTVSIKKTGAMLTFPRAELPEASIAYLIEYGLKQSLNDAHAGILPKDYEGGADNPQFAADVAEAVGKREVQIRTGAVPTSTAIPAHLVAVATSGLTPDEIMALVAGAVAKKAKAGKSA
jgi:hypothetical protein